MKILYIAYSCDPYKGSEDKFGWNIPYMCSLKETEVYLITKEEQRSNIEKYVKEKNIKNIKIYYVDIPKIYKNIFFGPIYSGRLNIWHRYAFSVAKEIIKNNNIEIIHQLTPVEFRAIGKYYKLKNIKYIVGPIGGGEYIPKTLYSYLNLKNKIIEFVRKVLNGFYKKKFFFIKKKIDYVLYANKETAEYLNEFDENLIYTEIGISSVEIKNIKNINTKNIFIVPGRIIYRKGHKLLFDAVSKLDIYLDYQIRIIGDGPMLKELQQIVSSDENLKKHIVFCGMVDYKNMQKEYENCKAIIMPSLRETTGTVILEAISNGKPVIAYNGFGSKNLLNPKNNFLYSGKSKEEIISNLARKILDVIKKDTSELSLKLIDDSKKYTFEEKYDYYNKIYKGGGM